MTIGYATVRKWRGIRLWHIGVAVVFASALMAVSTMFADEDVTEYYAVIISILFCCAVRHYDSTFKACSKEKQGAFDGHNMRYCDCGAGCQYGCDRTWMYRQKQLQCQCGRYAKGNLSWQKRMQADNDVPFYRLRIQADLLKMMAHDTAMLLEHSFLP